MGDDLWIFGYGSLIWRPDFAHVERTPAWIDGFARRFWQASPDHRGVPEAPGRVVTLVEQAGAVCWGVAYRVAGDARDAVLARLDDRESGGFERRTVAIQRRGAQRVDGLVYIAAPGNPNFLGPEPPEEIASVIRRARGCSGPNAEYLLRLAEALREIDGVDSHVAELVSRLRSG